MRSLVKRGLSPVVAVVLLLLITVIAAGLIVSFVIPFARDNLEESEACFEASGDLEFDETPFNCYFSSSEEAPIDRTGFSVRIDNENIIGFRVALQATGSSDAVSIEDGSVLEEIRMLGEDFSVGLEVPEKGGVRTYVAMGAFESVEIFPILASGDQCGVADEIKLNGCTDDEVTTLLTEF